MSKDDKKKEIENKVKKLRTFLDGKCEDTYEETVVEQYCNEYYLYLTAMKDLEGGDYTNIHDQISPACTLRNQTIANMVKLEKLLDKILEMNEDDKEKLPNMKVVGGKNF